MNLQANRLTKQIVFVFCLVIFFVVFLLYQGFDSLLVIFLDEHGSLAPYVVDTIELTRPIHLALPNLKAVMLPDSGARLLVILIFFSTLLVFAKVFTYIKGIKSSIRFPKKRWLRGLILVLTILAVAMSSMMFISVPLLTMLYSIWYAFLVLPSGLLIWIISCSTMRLVNRSLLQTILMSIALGTLTQGLIAWSLLTIASLSFVNMLLAELALLTFLLLIVRTRKETKPALVFNTTLFQEAYLSAFVLLLAFILALGSGWFVFSWNQIPWFDPWVWWGRGFSSSVVGKFWDAGYMALGNSPMVSALFGSVFSVWPDKVSSLHFMRVFSLFLVYLSSLGVYQLTRLLLTKVNIARSFGSLVSTFSALCFISNSWVLFYSLTFVRELLGITIFLAALTTFASEARNKTFQIAYCAFVSVFIFLLSPFTAFYSWIFAAALMITFFAKVRAHLSVGKLVLCISSVFAICTALVVLTLLSPLSPGANPLASNLKPNLISSFLATYYIINAGGLLSFILASIGCICVLMRIKRINGLYPFIAFFVFIFVITIAFPIHYLVYRHAFYLGLAFSALSPFGIYGIIEVVKRAKSLTKERVTFSFMNKKSLFTLLLSLVLLTQLSYGFMHAGRIDRSNESQIVSLLMDLDQRLPVHSTVIVDGPLVDKALGLLAPRHVHTWGLVKDFENATSNTSTLMNLVRHVAVNEIYFIAVSGGDYFVENVLMESLRNLDIIAADYTLEVYYVGRPFLLVYGYQDVYLFTFSSKAFDFKPTIGISLKEFELRENMSRNIKEVDIQSNGSSLMVSTHTCDESPAWIWLTERLPQAVSLRDYGLLFMKANGSNSSFINIGFSDSSYSFQAYLGDHSTEEQTYIFDLTRELRLFHNAELPFSSFAYVWIAIAGRGAMKYSASVDDIVLISSLIKPIESLRP